jgi:hypothetical protein
MRAMTFDPLQEIGIDTPRQTDDERLRLIRIGASREAKTRAKLERLSSILPQFLKVAEGAWYANGDGFIAAKAVSISLRMQLPLEPWMQEWLSTGLDTVVRLQDDDAARVRDALPGAFKLTKRRGPRTKGEKSGRYSSFRRRLKLAFRFTELTALDDLSGAQAHETMANEFGISEKVIQREIAKYFAPIFAGVTAKEKAADLGAIATLIDAVAENENQRDSLRKQFGL